jgi:hypothetical protein
LLLVELGVNSKYQSYCSVISIGRRKYRKERGTGWLQDWRRKKGECKKESKGR